MTAVPQTLCGACSMGQHQLCPRAMTAGCCCQYGIRVTPTTVAHPVFFFPVTWVSP